MRRSYVWQSPSERRCWLLVEQGNGLEGRLLAQKAEGHQEDWHCPNARQLSMDSPQGRMTAQGSP